MALPKRLKTARMNNSTIASLIDDKVGELEIDLADLLGIPIDSDQTTVVCISPNEKAAANGVASLNASGLVTQNPANATATPTAVKIPISGGGGKLDAGWLPDTYIPTSQKAAANGVASLSAGSLVLQNPVTATATPTATSIPISNGSGLLHQDWIPSNIIAYSNARFRAHGSITQTILTGGSDAITFPSETEDPDGWHSGSNTYVTLPSAGIYAVTCRVLGSGTAGQPFIIQTSGTGNPTLLYGNGRVTSVVSAGTIIGYVGGLIYASGANNLSFIFNNDGANSMSITEVSITIIRLT